MKFNELAVLNKNQVVTENQRLDEVAFVIPAVVWAVATAVAVGIAVDFAVEKVGMILENGRRKRWQFASDELPEGTRIYDADRNEYTYRRSGAEGGYSWYRKVGNRYDALPAGSATTNTISNAWQHSFDNRRVDFSDVRPQDFDRAYSVSQLRRLPDNAGRSYSDLVSLYERERADSNNRGVWSRTRQGRLRWAARAGIALTLVQAFAMYQLWTQTQELIELYKIKRDERLATYRDGQLRRYTPEDYDRDITGLRTMVLPIIAVMIGQVGSGVLTGIIIRAMSRSNRKPGWWGQLRRLPVIRQIVGASNLALLGIQLGTVAIALLPQLREEIADMIFQSFLVEAADDFIQQQLARLGVDYEEFFTDINMAEGDTQQAADDSEGMEPVNPETGDEIRPGTDDVYNILNNL